MILTPCLFIGTWCSCKHGLQKPYLETDNPGISSYENGAVGNWCPTPITESEKEPIQTRTKTCNSVYTCCEQPIIPSYLAALIDIEEKTRAENRSISSPLPLNPHHHHHFHHYMKYDREHNPTMPCKRRRELASRRHKRYACIIWPGEHHLWGDSQRP